MAKLCPWQNMVGEPRFETCPFGDNFGMTSCVLDVVCLCAAWCGTCGTYADTFRALQAALPGHRYRWIDIEDEADLVGDIDVETFPTLLVAHQGQVLFAGPVLPRLMG